jgi:hypothetical protein
MIRILEGSEVGWIGGEADLRCELMVCRFDVFRLCIERKLRSAGIAGLLMVVEVPSGGGKTGLGLARPC